MTCVLSFIYYSSCPYGGNWIYTQPNKMSLTSCESDFVIQLYFEITNFSSMVLLFFFFTHSDVG